MAAFMGRTEIGIKKTGTTVTVPGNSKAKLMYYLKCISTVLKMEDSDSEHRRLRDYQNYNRLTESETDQLVLLCFLLSPDVLNGKCIFMDENMCGDSSNEFYELSAVRNRMMLTRSILVGGQQRQIHKIMFYKPSWIRNNWIEPMEFFKDRLLRITNPPRPRALASSSSRRRSDNGCSVM